MSIALVLNGYQTIEFFLVLNGYQTASYMSPTSPGGRMAGSNGMSPTPLDYLAAEHGAFIYGQTPTSPQSLTQLHVKVC